MSRSPSGLRGISDDIIKTPQKRKAGIAMERKMFLPRLCFFTSTGLGVIGAALHTVCMLTQYEASLGYFKDGVLPLLLSILYSIAIPVTVVMALLIPKGTLGRELRAPHRAPIAYVLGLILAAFTVFSLITSYSVLFTKAGGMRTALTLCGLLAATYFVLSASRHGTFRGGLIWLGFLPIAWCLLAIAVTYSDPYVPMNSPLKASIQMGLLGFMLIMTAEMRYRLGKPLPRGAVALTGIGVFLTLTAGLPILLATPRIGDPLYPLCAGVLLFAGIYGGFMLYAYTHTPADAPPALDTAEPAVAEVPEFEDSPANTPEN